MGWLSRRRRTDPPVAAAGDEGRVAVQHLEEFARSRRGVEAYVEPATTVTPMTLLLIAHDGEWTRRAVPDGARAVEFAARLSMPLYDVNLTGYPQRMRDFNARRKAEG